MAGIFDKIGGFLFGTSPEFATKPRSLLDPAQQDLLAQLGELFGGRAEDIQAGTSEAPAFGGTLATQLDPTQAASLEGLGALANQISGADGVFAEAREGAAGAADVPGATERFEGGDFSQFTGEFGGAEGGAGDLLRQIFDEPAADFEEFFQTGVQDPLLRGFQEDILPGISRTQGPSGFFSGDRLRLDERAREDLLQQLVGARSDLAFRTDQARRDRRLTAAQGIGELEEAGLGRDFSGGQAALTRALTAAQEQDVTGRALAISDADRETQATLAGALGQGTLAAQEAGALGGIVSSGEIARRAEAENTMLEYQDFLRTSGFDDAQIDMMMQFLGLSTTENIVRNDPGSPGFLQAFASAAAQGGAFNPAQPTAPTGG